MDLLISICVTPVPTASWTCNAVSQLATPTSVYVDVNITNDFRQFDASLLLDTGCSVDMVLSEYKVGMIEQQREAHTMTAVQTANGPKLCTRCVKHSLTSQLFKLRKS